MPTPLVSVVLVSWNTRDLLAEAIASVAPTVASMPAEIIVVDNASADGSAAMVADRFPAVRLIRNAENVGFGRANNQGFAVATGAFVLLLNSDAALLPGTLEALVADLDAHPEAGAVGARLVFPDGRFQASFNDFPSLVRDGLALAGVAKAVYGACYPSHRESRSRLARDVDWIGGACMMLRRTALEATGGFDADYYIYSEEMDLCRRVWEAGWTVRYCPDAVAVHHGGQSTRQRPAEQPRLLWESRLLYYRKHHPRWEGGALGWMIRAAYLARCVAWGGRGALGRSPDRALWRRRARAAWGLATIGPR